EHLSAARDHEFTLTVTCPRGSDLHRQTTTGFSQYCVEKTRSREHYEIPSSTARLTVNLAFDVRGLDTMTAIRKRLTTAESSSDENSDCVD
ncbi:hypothetical protein AAVH_37637, partial [Aphelenchoides avenae]